MQIRERSPNSYFTVMELVQRLGYGFFQSRKKGVLKKKDFKIRRKFARSMAMKPEEYWTSDVAFCLYGVSFVYKSNPMSDEKPCLAERERRLAINNQR